MLLVLENHLEKSQKIKKYLEKNEIDVKIVDTLRNFFLSMEKAPPCLILLIYKNGITEVNNIMDNIGSEFPFCQFILLGPELSTSEKMELFERGVLDILAEDITVEELNLKIKNLQAFKECEFSTPSDELTKKLQLDRKKNALTIDENTFFLSLIEFQIMECLLKKTGHYVSHEELRRYIWKDVKGCKSLLSTHMTNLRKRIPLLKDIIKNRKGMGYTLFY